MLASIFNNSDVKFGSHDNGDWELSDGAGRDTSKDKCVRGGCGEAECLLSKKDNLKKCWCIGQLREPDENLQCPESEHSDPSEEEPKPKNTTAHGVIHNPKLKHIVQLHNNRTTEETQPLITETSPSSNGNVNLLYIILPVAAFTVILFVLTIIFWRRHRALKSRAKRNSEAMIRSSDSVQLLDRMNIVNKNPTYFCSSVHDELGSRKFPVCVFQLDQLRLQEIIGEGAFGQVYKGELVPTEDIKDKEEVAIKVLKDNVSHEIREDFEREVDIMSSFDHDNILKLVGVVTEGVGESPFMIFEYMAHGDLAELLRKNDPAYSKQNAVLLQKSDLIDIASQISHGMCYLASQHFVHRDLATRNCLVGEGLIVKISDFGMSRDIYTCDYYRIGGSRMLPVRWMSPESVKYGRFTTESDVWAFGVVLWEIFSYGRQPYYGHSNEEVVRFLDEGILLQRPDDCPSTVYHIMLGCWRQEPKDRMNFPKLDNHLVEYNKTVVKNNHGVPTADTDSETEVIA